MMEFKNERRRQDARAAFAKFKSQLRKAARTDPRITPKARNLVGAILDEIWSTEGYCGKPFEKLQHEIGAKCRRTVQRAAFDLERFGYFVVERSSGGGSKKTNHFRMPLSIPDATENVTLDQPEDVTLNVTLECHGQCDIPTAGSVTPPPRAVRRPDHPDSLKYSFKHSHHHAAARARADGADAPAAAAEDDDDFGLKGSEMLDELRRGLRTGEVSLGDVEDVLAEYRAEDPAFVSHSAEIVRRLEAGECVLDARAMREFGEAVRLQLIRGPADLTPTPPPAESVPPSGVSTRSNTAASTGAADAHQADDELAAAVTYWNASRRYGSGLGVNRRRQLSRILCVHGLAAWRRVVDAVPSWGERDPQCLSFDWVTRMSNFEEVLHGRLDDHVPTPGVSKDAKLLFGCFGPRRVQDAR